jgi:iron complex outermembrane receptor protein
MTPGDISMLLNETAGLRVQSTSPALGGAGVRIQGMRGRYASILSDGLPLHGGQTGALGPLQIPPMDLARVEVIKGAASALYGASALGGVINLISRRPAEANERELLLNQSTLGGTDAILWNSGPLGRAWGYTLLAGAHRQAQADVDDDAWADLPGFWRASVRPRFFWSGGRGGSAMVTVGVMREEREGGISNGSSSPGTPDYVERLATSRFDAGLLGRFLLRESLLVTVRGSAAVQAHAHRFGDAGEDDGHRTGFAEAALNGGSGRHTWVAGLAVQRDAYSADDVAGFDYTHTVPGIFAQADASPAEWLAVSGSGRLDHHSEYGTFFSPRLSILLRPDDDWTVRASAGGGYFAPTPWTDETEAVGLRRVVPLDSLAAERALTASLDIGRTFGPLEINATVFASRIRQPVQVRLADQDRLELFNAEGPVRTRGTELLARFVTEGVHITATHVYLRATEPTGGGRREVPLTPRQTAGLVAALEQEGRGRIGAEFYFTGRQELEANPYRSTSKPHVIVGFLVERRFGPVRLFLNAENMFDTRQTRHDPLVLPVRSPEGRWTTDVWAPLDGRSLNGGIRWEW